MRKRLLLAGFSFALMALPGCFRVGRLPATTAHGPSYEDPNSAIVIPRGSGTSVLSVNGEAVHTDFLDRLANLSLNLLLMYLEPQVYIKPGSNVLGVRGSESNTTSYGTYRVTTTRWRNFVMNVQANVGDRFLVQADVDRGTTITLDSSQRAQPTALAAQTPVEAEPTHTPSKKSKAKLKTNKTSKH